MSDTDIRVTIPVPEPDLTPADLIGRARALRDHLRAEQASTEQRGAYSPETHELFRAAGFYRTLLPRRFGGHEFDVSTFVKMVVEVARGCSATGWCLCLAAGHGLQLGGLWSESAQLSALLPDGDFAAPLRALPMGTAVRSPAGGWTINGKWDYCSGSPYSTHAMLAVRLDPDEANGARMGVALVPRADWTLLDDWKDQAFGMRGSGSNSIQVTGAVVPDDAMVFGSLIGFSGGLAAPGYELHGNPMYAGHPMGYLQLEITSILVGTAYAALDEFERIIRERTTMGPNPVPRYQHPDYQRHWGLASGKLVAAEAILLRMSDYYAQLCVESVEDLAVDHTEKLMTIHASTHHAINLAWEAIEILFRNGGTSESGRQGSRMERYWRDFSTARTNAGLQYEAFAQTYAKQHFGIEFGSLI
jgi:3-hydroxy-9,10-secoandrosta-1,3,5(10)-triene-9,17-dione monooxygenase